MNNIVMKLRQQIVDKMSAIEKAKLEIDRKINVSVALKNDLGMADEEMPDTFSDMSKRDIMEKSGVNWDEVVREHNRKLLNEFNSWKDCSRNRATAMNDITELNAAIKEAKAIKLDVSDALLELDKLNKTVEDQTFKSKRAFHNCNKMIREMKRYGFPVNIKIDELDAAIKEHAQRKAYWEKKQKEHKEYLERKNIQISKAVEERKSMEEAAAKVSGKGVKNTIADIIAAKKEEANSF